MARTLPFLALLTFTSALTITCPKPGDFINPGLPLTITWTTTAEDPASIDLVAIHPSPDTPDEFAARTQLGSSVASSAQKLDLPAWSILDWGVGYTVQVSAAGNPNAVLASVADLSLGGAVGQASTDAAGSVVGFITSAAGPAQESSLTGAGNPASATAAPTGTVSSVPIPAAATAIATDLASTTESVASETETSSSSSTAMSSSTSRESTSSTASASASATEASSAAVAPVKAVGSIAAAGWLGLVLAAVLA
ncbi:uncharacterized protein AB675_6887 [Cyphellophora attinorum]|uniref:Uncharacterized protein n=1 Tax=Cyphellophora attinorum TaxID=1664694 RepID=A0A0N1HED8_9EURO|nr:uncharacterized protein AB675_6887 [Phialophora attinorum]KPI43146.1 hypothetical protein AB675_6887 [Phialophora attinorum]